MKAYLFFDNGLPQITAFIAEAIKKHGHEIKIPERATHIRLMPERDEGSVMSVLIPTPIFPIPRPKKKVKRWQYITINSDRFGRKRGEVTGWLTEREAKERGLEPEDRIYQTEIEVE